MKRIGIGKRVISIFLFALIVMILIGCSKKDNKANAPMLPIGEISLNSNEASQSNEQAATGKEQKNEHNNEQTIISSGDKLVVDGYDITKATTGTSLKDAYAGYFTMGVAINGSHPSNSTVASDAMAEIMKYHFNSTTFSNLMKPMYLLDQRASMRNYNSGIETPAVNFSSIIDGMEFAKENNIKMRGHVLVWHEQAPDWFFREGYESSGKYVEKETMLMRMENYIKQVLEFTQTQYPGVIYCWDVVNEAVENNEGAYELESGYEIRTNYHSGENLWYKVIGVDYVVKAFEYARKYADPKVKLFYNDYNSFQEAKTQSIYDLVFDLKQKGLVDGLGMQGYMDLVYPEINSGVDNVRSALSKFSDLGLEIHITELTIRSQDKSSQSFRIQADRYEELFKMLIEMDTDGGGPANITNVTFFAIMDEYLFYRNNNNPEYHRLFDGQLQPKPAFYSVLSVVD
ncbi:endo-1,4-beta-xylanase [Mobilitalea sibirica]|uniref:Beta-xylanase n=1 Tax=Mobilitalea sibirica TaxID=1462919 RepID=A0A8J7KZG7_9FIRM|nr:endo-1,4-beta-xylanase [Mobilitalea sibirica]MBH1940173.1 endo-1,4-beta-xylanase [Mobilitalea sibirica]